MEEIKPSLKNESDGLIFESRFESGNLNIAYK